MPVGTLRDRSADVLPPEVLVQRHAGYRQRVRMGPAGPKLAWHHIVEQTPGNVARFGPEAIHNTVNIIRLPHGAGTIHAKISGFYSSVRPEITGSNTLRIREWLSTQSFEAQMEFGVRALKNVGDGIW